MTIYQNPLHTDINNFLSQQTADISHADTTDMNSETAFVTELCKDLLGLHFTITVQSTEKLNNIYTTKKTYRTKVGLVLASVCAHCSAVIFNF